MFLFVYLLFIILKLHLRIVGSISASIGSLITLSHLDISGNKLSGMALTLVNC